MLGQQLHWGVASTGFIIYVTSQAVAEAAAALAAREAQQAAEAAAAQAASSIARLAALQDALLPEPSADAAKSTYATCLFRLPDGHRISRRFLLSHPQAQLYTFVDSMGGGGLQPGSYQLVAQFPRRVIPSPGASYAPHTLPGSQSGGMYPAAASQQLQLRQADVHMQDAGQQHASNAAGGSGSAPGSHEAVVGDILSGGAQEAFLLEPLEPLPAQTVTG